MIEVLLSQLCKMGSLHRLWWQSKYLDTIIGNQNGMFKLRRQAVIDRRHGPVIIPLKAVPRPLRQHGFNRKNHARHELASVAISVMLDKRSAMEFFANTMASVLANRAIPCRIGHILNGSSNIRQAASWPTCFNGSIQTVTRRLDQSSGLFKVSLVFLHVKVGPIRDASPVASNGIVFLCVPDNDCRAVIAVDTIQKAAERARMSELV